MNRTTLVLTFSAFTLCAVADSYAQTVDIREWPVPYAGRPRDPFVDPTNSSRVWFVGQAGHYVASLDAKTGEFRKFDLAPGTGPHNVIVDRSGIVWYSGNLTGHIGKLDPATGTITRYPMPDSTVRDPHTLIFDANGDIWFTAQQSQVVGKLTVATGKVDIIRLPEFGQRVGPYGIVIDKSGRLFFNAFATNKIGMVDPKTMTAKAFDLPSASRSRRIAITSDQMIWYVDYATGHLGRLNPATAEVKEWNTPGGATSQPYAMAVDDKDRIWFTQSQPRTANEFVGFDPRTEKFFSSSKIPSGGGTVRHMVFQPGERVIWFGTDTGNIGRAIIPQ